MNPVDLFGGLSSDEEEDVETTTPLGSNSTLMAEMQMSDDEDPLESLVAEIRRKSNSTSPDQASPPSVKKPKTPEQVKFFLSSDDDASMDMPDIESISNMVKMEMEKKRKLEAIDAAKHVTAMEPLVKRPKELVVVEQEMNMPSEVAMVPTEEQTLLELIKERERQACNVDVSGWSEDDQLHQLKIQVLLKNMSKEQLDRFEVFRSSKFQRTTIRRLIKDFTGGVQIADNVVLAVAALAKMVVGDVVEEALDLRDAKQEEAEHPLQPHHVRQAMLNLKRNGTL